jgi:hypothetical protein
MGVTYTRILRYGLGFVGILLLGLTIADLGRPAGVPALPRIGTETPAEGDIARQPAEFTGAPPVNSWYFAVSGDSRDCGDVIMPKIAASVATKAKQMPVKFYWHLGDFRAFYRIDCDLAKRKNEATKCAKDYDPYQAIPQDLQPTPDYVNAAWQDFIDRQVLPFEKAGIPFYLGIGNHELIKRTPAEYTATFKKWLTQPAIVKQQKIDVSRKIPPRDSQTYFHFVLNGVDFIFLDNADIYNQDPVLVLASHSHYIESNIYDTPEHTNDVLSGWIIGTAGAEQYRSQIRYGYLLVEVKSNGQFNPSFQEVKADPADQSSITKYCFEKNNKEPDPNEKYFTKNQCACN